MDIQQTPRGPAYVFDPVLLSKGELEFLLEHLGTTPNVALHNFKRRPGVNPVAVREVMQIFIEHQELQESHGEEWAGYETIADSIQRWLAWQERCIAIWHAGGPRHPSMHNWDSDGQMTKHGIGSDSCDRVRSEILDNGEHRVFKVQLVGGRDGAADLMPWLKKTDEQKAAVQSDRTKYDARKCAFTCGVCGEIIATHKAGSTRAKRQAEARVLKHLKTARVEPARHRAVMRLEYK